MGAYNDKTVYGLFQTPFRVDCDVPTLNIPLIHIDDSSRPNERSWYNSDLLPDSIYVSYKKYVSTFTTTVDYPQFILLNYDAPETDHNMTRNEYDSNKFENRLLY